MPRAKKGSRKPAFEQALARLEAIVKDLEEGDLKLEDSLRLYEEGVSLTRLCATRLDEAQRRVDLLTRGDAGELKLVPFEDGEDDAPRDGDEPDADDR